jgi:hypothetical protein
MRIVGIGNGGAVQCLYYTFHPLFPRTEEREKPTKFSDFSAVDNPVLTRETVVKNFVGVSSPVRNLT